MHNKHAKSMNLKTIIICSAAALVIAAVAIILFLLLLKKNPIPTDSSYLSSISSVTSEITSSEEPIVEEPEVFIPKLIVTAPQKTSFTTTSQSFLLSGNSDPTIPLTLNGADVARDENGNFSFDVQLNVGKNTLNLVHGEESKVFVVTYRYVVINGYSPASSQKYGSGSTFGVCVSARRGSAVSATFNGQTISLIATTAEEGDEFTEFNGSFTLPKDNIADLNLGKITFTATHNGVTETFSSGVITCRKSSSIVDSDPAVTPQGGNYIDVGSGLIGEVVHFQAETFDAYSTNDWSSPANNYLPKGTMDYISGTRVYSSDKNPKEYAVMRYGKQVYTKINDKPNKAEVQIIKEYIGTLPDHNEIKLASMSEEGRFTTLTFDCLWKAPFNFNIPQSYPYYSSKSQNFSIDSFGAAYIDIVFCYATIFEGEILIGENNPVFKSAEIIKNPTGADHTLRLHLKKNGGFYGWDAYYNNEGQLCFEFLHPAKVTASTENGYGVRLDGVTIVVDAGHNGAGVDVGALGSNSAYHEANRNLNLALKIKAELESLGATVILTRDTEVSGITYQGRIEMVKNLKPDYCISVHHNSSTSASPNGFLACYGTPYSYTATQFVSDRNENTGIYNYTYPYKWHYFYLARVSNCPVVLTENGFMSNGGDYNKILDDASNGQKASAIVSGIVDYFNSIQ